MQKAKLKETIKQQAATPEDVDDSTLDQMADIVAGAICDFLADGENEEFIVETAADAFPLPNWIDKRLFNAVYGILKEKTCELASK
jgi:hypothetical protein